MTEITIRYKDMTKRNKHFYEEKIKLANKNLKNN
jgi:hypothetical protein